MKRILIIIVSFYGLTANGQNYLISFAGSGASTSVSSVKVENLTSGASLTLSGSDILRLNITTGVNSIEKNQSGIIKIYPNPMTDNSTLEICPPTAGDAIITVCDMTGKLITQIQSHLKNFRQDFRVSGIKKGFYFINVKGNNYQFSGKLVSNGNSGGIVSIDKFNVITRYVNKKTEKADSKGIQATVDMAYTSGDRLKLTGISGIYSTVITDIPAIDKTITFNFVACTDGDNNNYPVVEIGSQIWMAENLKTTKYNNGTDIPVVTNNVEWRALVTPGFCWYINDEASYKGVYGALYNWYTTNDENLCPTDWHVPTDAEWTTLENYLIANGYNYDGTITGNQIAKSLASTTMWTSSTTLGAVGNTDFPGKRNASGFTALPGGIRWPDGPFFFMRDHGFWWSATELGPITALGRGLVCYTIDVSTVNYDKKGGFSVRCLKDY